MNFWERIWQRRWVRHIEWSLASLGTLVVFLIILVDWSGAQCWHAAKERLAKEGLTLDLRAVAPEPIAEAENFCAIPLLKDTAQVIDGDEKEGESGKKRARLLQAMPPIHAEPDGASLGQRTDLKKWTDMLRKEGSTLIPKDSGDAARDILSALARQDDIFKELAAGLPRARAQFTPPWKTRDLPKNPFMISFPHLWPVAALDGSLAWRCVASTRAGDATMAHESAQIMARLTAACLEEPSDIGLSVATKGATNIANVTWELCDAQAGTREDFARLESALAGMDFRQATWRAAGGELIVAVDELQFAKQSPGHGIEFIGTRYGYTVENLIIRCMPAGFFDANAAVLADREFDRFVKPLRDRGWESALVSARGMGKDLQEIKANVLASPAFIATAMHARGGFNIVCSAIYAQTLINQARIACALERYRMEKGSYPESLTDLRLADGKPLPAELLTGRPMSYRKTPNGKYALWSPALSRIDHGGQRALNKEHPEMTKFYREEYAGDWVWDFPEKE